MKPNHLFTAAIILAVSTIANLSNAATTQTLDAVDRAARYRANQLGTQPTIMLLSEYADAVITSGTGTAQQRLESVARINRLGLEHPNDVRALLSGMSLAPERELIRSIAKTWLRDYYAAMRAAVAKEEADLTAALDAPIE